MNAAVGMPACALDAHEWPVCETPVLDALARYAEAPLLVLHGPAPVMPPEWLLRALPSDDAFAWCPPEGVAFAAVGRARSLPSSQWGERIGEAAGSMLEGLVEASLGAGDPVPTRAVASLPFELGRSGQGALFVPRWRFALSRTGAWLSFATTADERSSDAARRRLAAEWEAVRAAFDAVASRRRTSEPPMAARVLRVDHGDVEGWKSAVERTVEAIRNDRFAKVVLARSAEVELDRAFDACDVLERLSVSGWGTRYAFRHEGVTFVGLSPERLVSRRGAEVHCDALAGTARSGGEGELQLSSKDLIEHRHVVREIVRALRPLCRSVTASDEPTVRVLRHLSHLLTPVRGELDEAHHVLDFVRALHPTPATGGVPGEGALAFLREVEGRDRGLYAGPIGWFDANGDGDFWVALRCGVLDGTRATVWAGAGIVHDSQPDAELSETQLKQRAFLLALGADA